MASGHRLELFLAGTSIGWLGENSGQWCVVAGSGAAATLEWYTWKGVNYLRHTSDTSRYLSVSDTAHWVGFYNWSGARGWTLNGDVLTSQYTNAPLSYWSSSDGYVYANSSKGYHPLTVKFHDAAEPHISHVFVLMLENHSFDNIFAFSGISGLHVAPPGTSNTYTFDGKTVTYPVSSDAPTSMPTDPGHEFLDTVEQLTGQKAWQPGQQYPAITNSGYVANYATTTTESEKGKLRLPVPDEYGDVMQCFDTRRQLPVIYQLATEFAICDQWFSSLPGPTWPNRFFVHGASSGNWDDSPTPEQIFAFESVAGFKYPHGSIYDSLTNRGVPYRLYVEREGNPLGGLFPQVAGLKGIFATNIHSFSDFKSDVQDPNYKYRYTFIEPNYGDVWSGTYRGGSSQHPMDGMAAGEALIKATYEALRASPLWTTSVLIVTYDEHGGFFDSATPPRSATPPGDGATTPANQHGFAFDQYGVRVPAIVVSPLIPKGTVDHTLYDHSSVLATLEELFALPPLTNRDRHANHVLHLLTQATPRTDCPTTLPDPHPDATVDALDDVAPAAEPRPPDEPLPQSGNVQGFLGVVLKTDVELSDGSPATVQAIVHRVRQITTRAEAEEYAAEVQRKVQAAQAAHVEVKSSTLAPA